MDAQTLLLINLTIGSIALFASLLMIAGMWAVCRKADQPGWSQIVPGYNIWVMVCGVARLNPVWFYALIAPPVVITLLIMASCCGGMINPFLSLGFAMIIQVVTLISYFGFGVLSGEVARRFGRGTGFGIGLAIFPYIFWPILGFNDDRYIRKLRPVGPKRIDYDDEDDDYDDDEDDDDDEYPRRRRR